MLKRLIHFIKYNNVAVFVILAVFLLTTGALATETGQELIGEEQTRIEGVDNTLLLEADLDKFDMKFKIEKIEEDNKMYYVIYTYFDLTEFNNAWRYQVKENIRRVSKKFQGDLGVYLAEELSEEYKSRIKELKAEQEKAQEGGEEKRLEVVEYSGLVGQVLNAVSKVFPDYEPVKVRQLATPVPDPIILAGILNENTGDQNSQIDDLTQVYKEYMEENDPDEDGFFYSNDNCPMIYNPGQADADEDGIGDVCDIDNLADEGGSGTATTTAGELSDESEAGVDSESEESEAETETEGEASGNEIELVEELMVGDEEASQETEEIQASQEEEPAGSQEEIINEPGETELIFENEAEATADESTE